MTIFDEDSSVFVGRVVLLAFCFSILCTFYISYLKPHGSMQKLLIAVNPLKTYRYKGYSHKMFIKKLHFVLNCSHFFDIITGTHIIR
jgi:hypothetical protein